MADILKIFSWTNLMFLCQHWPISKLTLKWEMCCKCNPNPSYFIMQMQFGWGHSWSAWQTDSDRATQLWQYDKNRTAARFLLLSDQPIPGSFFRSKAFFRTHQILLHFDRSWYFNNDTSSSFCPRPSATNKNNEHARHSCNITSIKPCWWQRNKCFLLHTTGS